MFETAQSLITNHVCVLTFYISTVLDIPCFIPSRCFILTRGLFATRIAAHRCLKPFVYDYDGVCKSSVNHEVTIFTSNEAANLLSINIMILFDQVICLCVVLHNEVLHCLCNPGTQNTFNGCITSGASTVRPSCHVTIKSPMDFPENSMSLDIFSALAALRSMHTGSICIDAGMISLRNDQLVL